MPVDPMVLNEIKTIIVERLSFPYSMWEDVHLYFEKIMYDGVFINEWNDHYIKSTNMKGIDIKKSSELMVENVLQHHFENIDDLTKNDVPYFLEINFGIKTHYHHLKKGIDFKVNVTEKIYLDMFYKYKDKIHYIGYNKTIYPISHKWSYYGFFDVRGNRRFLKVKLSKFYCNKDFCEFEEKE